MSDIAKKTLPPGARGKPAPSKPTETSSDPSAPRSGPSAPQKLPADDDAATVSSDNFSRSGACEEDHDHGDHYTHASEKVPDIPEENDGEAPQDDEQEPIKMQDQDKTEDLEDVEPKPVDDEEQETEKISDKKSQTQDRLVNGDVPSEAPEQKEDATEGASTPAPSGRESAQSGVTEEAKRAFDEVSENQPTSQAGIPAEQSEAATEKQIPEGQDVSKDISDKAPSEAQEPAETATEKAPTVTEQAPTEKAPTELGEQQEQVPSEQGTAIQDQAPETVASPSQIGADEGGAPTEQGSQFPAEGTVQEPEQSVQEESGVPEGSQAAPSETVAEQLDFSVLKNGRVNKGGNIVTDEGRVVGRVTQGILQYLVGKRVDENGAIWSDSGKVIGQAEPISDSERDDMLKESAPFESFPDATVDGNGMVVSNGEWVGKVVEGDVSRLRGKSVDADGDILDKGGNVIGRAERWEPEPEAEAEPEPEVDKSALAGKRVNKAGNVVDGSGVIWGRIVEGDVKRMIGRMCDKNGNVLSESGDILGKAELVSEGEREGLKEGPFAELQGCTVAKDGTVVTPSGDIVGRLTSGDGKVLFGRAVDEDGDVLDRNGNVIGKAERWEPEVVERKKHPMCGRRVNREGNVVDEDGNLIGKLTSGDPRICSGKEIDNDGDVVDSKGTVIGHCTLIEEIQEEETESPEDKEKREQQEQNKKLAIQMTTCIEQCLERIRPICKMITEKIDKAERTPEDQRAEDHEEQLVKEVRPLIEEGGHILTEAKGIIKGLDPDGRIAANAKHKTAAREATPEEYRLADVLKDLTGDVTQCIENSKRKLEDLPRAKKELNPLWGLLNEPLFQILAAVGLLLSGVLNLVGRLLSGLGLGGLVDGLLGTLGINRVLGALGLGSFSKGLKSGKKGGGLLGGVLGG